MIGGPVEVNDQRWKPKPVGRGLPRGIAPLDDLVLEREQGPCDRLDGRRGHTELGKAGAKVSHHGIEGIIRDAGRDAWSVGAG